MRTPFWCRTRATEIGPACRQVVDGLLEVNALFRLRAAQGVLGLADRHSPSRLEAACSKAIAVGDPSFRTIKGISGHALSVPDDSAGPCPKAADAGILGRELIDELTVIDAKIRAADKQLRELVKTGGQRILGAFIQPTPPSK